MFIGAERIDLNEVLSIRAQEYSTSAALRTSHTYLNEVLSIRAQEYVMWVMLYPLRPLPQ